MLIIFLSLAIATVAVTLCLYHSNKKEWIGLEMFFLFGLSGFSVAWVLYAIVSYYWIGSDYKANLLNKEYGTAYTQEQVFWASDVIDTIRQMDRKRIQIQGELENKNLNVDLINPACIR